MLPNGLWSEWSRIPFWSSFRLYLSLKVFRFLIDICIKMANASGCFWRLFNFGVSLVDTLPPSVCASKRPLTCIRQCINTVFVPHHLKLYLVNAQNQHLCQIDLLTTSKFVSSYLMREKDFSVFLTCKNVQYLHSTPTEKQFSRQTDLCAYSAKQPNQPRLSTD